MKCGAVVYVPGVRNPIRICSALSSEQIRSYEIKYQNDYNKEHKLGRSCGIYVKGGANAIQKFGGRSKGNRPLRKRQLRL
jgi:hypothetical protein